MAGVTGQAAGSLGPTGDADQRLDSTTGSAKPDRSHVSATRAALEVIHRLEAAHGPVAFFQSGGCCDGSAPICLKAGELEPGRYDVELGRLGEAPFYVDSDLYERWSRPRFCVDVAVGPAEGFSLEGLVGVHFVTRTEG